MTAVCEQCGKNLDGEIIKLVDPYQPALSHYFCSDDCAKEWLFENAEWDYIDASEIEEAEGEDG